MGYQLQENEELAADMHANLRVQDFARVLELCKLMMECALEGEQGERKLNRHTGVKEVSCL